MSETRQQLEQNIENIFKGHGLTYSKNCVLKRPLITSTIDYIVYIGRRLNITSSDNKIHNISVSTPLCIKIIDKDEDFNSDMRQKFMSVTMDSLSSIFILDIRDSETVNTILDKVIDNVIKQIYCSKTYISPNAMKETPGYDDWRVYA